MPEPDAPPSDRSTTSQVPYTASYLAMADGVLVVLNALTWLLIGQAYGVTIDDSPYAVYTISITGLIFGLMIIVAGIRVRTNDDEWRMSWAAVIAIFSAISLALAGGGFVVGFVLGMIAVAMIIRSVGEPRGKVKLASKH